MRAAAPGGAAGGVLPERAADQAHHAPRPAAGAVRSLPRDARRAARRRPLEPALRIFEKRLLEVLGYGLDLGSEALAGRRSGPGYYHFRPAAGTVRDRAGAPAHSRATPCSPSRPGARARVRSRMRAGCSRRRWPHAWRGAAHHARRGPRHAATRRPRMSTPLALGVNIDHVATLRQARRARAPDPVHAALLAEQPAPTASRCTCARTAATSRTATCARPARPAADAHEPGDGGHRGDAAPSRSRCSPPTCAWCPSARGGDHRGRAGCGREISRASRGGRAARRAPGIRVSLFIDPGRERQIEAARALGAPAIELHTGAYARSCRGRRRRCSSTRLAAAVRRAARSACRCTPAMA